MSKKQTKESHFIPSEFNVVTEYENKFISEMKCLVDKVDTIFYYEFDNNNYLQKIMMYQNEKMQCMFNREKELKELKKEYLELDNIQLSKIG